MADDRTPAGAGHYRYPGLDLLRALAIVLVVNCHAATAFGSRPEYRALQLGGKGVDLFFVLSGWLLGRQLMRELRDTNTIDLRRFWYRRWLRTLPAYYAVLAFTFAWQLARGNYDLRWSYLFFGQTYLTDLPYFGVSWSLCVEEHFYLAVAPVLLLFWRVRAALVLLPLLLVLPFVCRSAGWLVHPDGGGIETHARYDPCAVGVLLAAIDVARPRLWAVLRSLAPFLALAGLVAAGRDVACRLNPQWGLGDQGITAWALIFGSWVLLAAARPGWAVGRLPGVRYVAERSYAVYLLHPEAFALLKKLDGLPFVAFLALTWAVSLLLAEVLYRLVERPGMRLRERFGASRTREPAPPAQAP
jgi:peptidoglycan/LPS O-acetylase OafA/YrhL